MLYALLLVFVPHPRESMKYSSVRQHSGPSYAPLGRDVRASQASRHVLLTCDSDSELRVEAGTLNNEIEPLMSSEFVVVRIC